MLLGRAQPVIPPNLYCLMLFTNIKAWGPQVKIMRIDRAERRLSTKRESFS